MTQGTKAQNQELVRNFINAMFSMLETCMIHFENNDALKRPSDKFVAAIQALVPLSEADDQIVIDYQEDLTTVQNIRLILHYSIAGSLPEIEDAFLTEQAKILRAFCPGLVVWRTGKRN